MTARTSRVPGSPWSMSAFAVPPDPAAAGPQLAAVRALRSRILYDRGRRPAFLEADDQPHDLGAWHFLARREPDGPALGYIRLLTADSDKIFQSRQFLGDREYESLLRAEDLAPGEVFEHSRLVVEHRIRKLGLGVHLNALAVAAARELGGAAMIATAGTADGQDRFQARFGFRVLDPTRRYVERYTEDVVIILHHLARGGGEYHDLVEQYRELFTHLAKEAPEDVLGADARPTPVRRDARRAPGRHAAAPYPAPASHVAGLNASAAHAAGHVIGYSAGHPAPHANGHTAAHAVRPAMPGITGPWNGSAAGAGAAAAGSHPATADAAAATDAAAPDTTDAKDTAPAPGAPAATNPPAASPVSIPFPIRSCRLHLPKPTPADHTRFKPVLFTPSEDGDRAALDSLGRSGAVRELCDTLPAQLDELVTSREPALAAPDAAADRRAAVVDQLAGQEPADYGTWVWYPWSGRLVHILPREEFRLVRTDRNRTKIDRPDQRRLFGRRVGVIGLSVGASAALTLAQEGVGGTFRLADFDTLALSNLNRLRAGVDDLGQSKAVLAARRMSEIDPYLDIEVFPHGLTAPTLDAFLGGAGTGGPERLDLLVEECDTPWVKLAAREAARERGVPVVMDTNDRGMLDVERFDLEPDRPLLHGRLGDLTSADLGRMTPRERVELIADMIDPDRMSPALRHSIHAIGDTLSSWPQLASGVALGGALVTEAARRIFLGRPCPSGRYYVDLEELIAADRDMAAAGMAAVDLLSTLASAG